MKKLYKILLPAILGLIPSIAVSNEIKSMSNFNYQYLDADFGVEPSSYGLGMSRLIHPNAHMLGSIETSFNQDLDMRLGFGFHAPLNNWSDLTGNILLRYFDRRYTEGDFGSHLNLGVRQWLGPQLEVAGDIGYFSYNHHDDVTFTANARFHATELIAIGLEYRHNEFFDRHQFVFGVRLNLTNPQ